MAGSSTVPIKIFRTHLCPHILIMCGMRGTYSDKEPRDREKGSDITVRESGCAG
jgi:hypothetical protein